MAQNNSNHTILAVIAAVLVGIFGVLVYTVTKDSPAENAAESISEGFEDFGNSVEDASENVQE